MIGHKYNSSAVQVNALQSFSDIMVFLIGMIGVRWNLREIDKENKYTYAYRRADVLACLINAVLLTTVCFTTIAESLHILAALTFSEKNNNHIEDLNLDINSAKSSLYVGIFSFAVSSLLLLLTGSYICSKRHNNSVADSEKILMDDSTLNIDNNTLCNIKKFNSQLNIKTSNSSKLLSLYSINLHIIENIASSILLIVNGIFSMHNFDINKIVLFDTIVSAVISIIIFLPSIKLYKNSLMILMQSCPFAIDIFEIKECLMKDFIFIKNIHDIHVWQLSEDIIIASIHLSIDDYQNFLKFSNQLHLYLNKYGIKNATFQPEISENNSSDTCAYL